MTWFGQAAQVLCDLFIGANRRWQLYLAGQSIFFHAASYSGSMSGLVKSFERRQTVRT